MIPEALMEHDPIEAKLTECTDILRDDPELQLETKAELRSHLESVRDDLIAEGKNESEALQEACRRLGDSEAVSQGLLQADFARLKLHAKIRIFLRLMILPMLLIAAYLAVDWRFFLTFLNSSILNGGDPSALPMAVPRFIRSVIYGKSSPDMPGGKDIQRQIGYHHNFTAKEWELMFLDSGNHLEKYSDEQIRELLKRHADNPVFQGYIISLLTSGEPRPERLAALRDLDPDNGLADLMTAGLLAGMSFSKHTHRGQQVTIADRAKMEQAMKHLHLSLEKPYIHRYPRDLMFQRLRLLNAAPDICGYIEQLEISSTISLTDLMCFRNISVGAVLWGELLEKEGRKDEAAWYFEVWKKLLKTLNDSSFCLIEQLVVGTCLNYNYQAALRCGDRRRAAELKAPAAVVEAWRKSPDPEKLDKMLRRHGGLFSSMLLPALKRKFTSDDLKSDRQISYLILEIFLCAISGSYLLLMFLFHSIAVIVSRLMNRKSFLLAPEIKTLLREFLLYLILPLALYLLLTRTDWIGGREYAVMENGWRTLIFSLYFLSIPIIYLAAANRRIRRRMKQLGTERISSGQRGLNLLPVLLLGLIAVCGIMRLVIAGEQRYWITRDHFFYGSPVGFSQAEDSVVNFLKEQHARSWPKR